METRPRRTPYLPGATTCRALNLLCEGYTSKEIARVLGNSPATVTQLLAGAAKALGLPTGKRTLLAVTWTRLCPPVEEAAQLEPPTESTPPIYTLIDGVTGRRMAGLHAGVHERQAQDERIEAQHRRTSLHPRQASAGPLPTQTRAEVGYRGITRHARWMLRTRARACYHCAYTLSVDVCHIKPVHSFAPDALLADINAPHNLIYLCPNCHRALDVGLWALPETETTTPDGAVAPELPQRPGWSSRYRGVFWEKTMRRWRVTIASAGKRYYIGNFVDEREAALAYNAAALRLHGDRAVLNTVD